MTDMDTA